MEVGPGGGGEGFLEAPSPTFGAASPEEEGTLLRRRSHQKTTPSRCAPAGPRLCWGGGEGGPGSSVNLGRSPSGQPICGGRFVAVVRSFLPSQTLSLVGGKKLRCTKNKCDPSARSSPRSWGQRQRARPGPAAARLPHTALPGPGKRPKPRSSGVAMRDTGGGAERGAKLCPSPLAGEETLSPGTTAQSGEGVTALSFRLQTDCQGEAEASRQEELRGAVPPRPPCLQLVSEAREGSWARRPYAFEQEPEQR